MTPDLEQLFAADALLSNLRDRVAARLAADDDPAHDLAHALRVARVALSIAEVGVEPRNLVAAALLHDAVNVPKDSPERARASQLCADFARGWLPEHGFDAEAVDQIADAIRDHSYSRGATPASALGRALQDADRLEAVGALGLMRCLSTGARMGARYFDPADPWASQRALDDRRYSVDHFFTKLLDLPETMLTEGGRAEGRRRARFLRSFLEQLGSELGEAPPVGDASA